MASAKSSTRRPKRTAVELEPLLFREREEAAILRCHTPSTIALSPDHSAGSQRLRTIRAPNHLSEDARPC
jgi:hypothetical protein